MENPTRALYCSRCGAKRPAAANFCPYCGTAYSTASASQSNRKGRPIVLYVIIALVLMGLCGIISSVVEYHVREKHQPSHSGSPQISVAQTDSTDAFQNQLRSAIAKHAKTFHHSMAVQNGGSAVHRDSALGGWTNVASVGEVGAWFENPVALRWDGTVLTGDNNPTVAGWRNIVAICGGDNNELVGLRLDGTVVSSDPASICNTWTNIDSIQLADGMPYLIGITKDGRVVSQNTDFDVSLLTNIVQVAGSMDMIVGLRQDGTVLYTNRDGTFVMQGWTDVTAVDCYYDILALRKDGTVLSTAEGIFDIIPDFSGWNNIVAIQDWGYSYIGLKADGTVVTTGLDEAGQVEIPPSWSNVVSIKLDNYTTLALTESGSVLASDYPQPNIRFTNVALPYGS